MTEDEIKNARILILDDEPANVLLLTEILKSANYKNILGLTDSRKVLKQYQTFKPDLVLLDINMPYLDGFEVMEELKKIEKESYIPVLVLTAQTDMATRKNALKSGARDFLNKPFSIEETLARIYNLLEVRLLHSELKNYNEILEEKVIKRTQELKDSKLETVHKLVEAAEYRDNETGLHIIRMSRYCCELAKNLKLNKDECDVVLYSSPMHDIGKVGIPDYILLKPDKLDAEEWTRMKTHTNIGGNILANSKSKLLQTGEIIALTHHERWDGTGYPKGLKKEEIPLTGRIVTICDVFDALTSKRPYKPAWSVEESIAEMKKQIEIFFDPEIFKVFLNILPEILKIRDEVNRK